MDKSIIKETVLSSIRGISGVSDHELQLDKTLHNDLEMGSLDIIELESCLKEELSKNHHVMETFDFSNISWDPTIQDIIDYVEKHCY